jgi:hypothetical protein
VPMKPVTVRRWEIVAAFVGIVAGAVIGITIATHANNASHRAALQAKAAALQAKQAADQAAKTAEANKRAVERLRRVKVSVVTLEKGQCKIKAFLISSAGVRARLAAHEPNPTLRRKDLQAAAVARRLGRSFSNERCPS